MDVLGSASPGTAEELGEPALSSNTLAILNQFLAEQKLLQTDAQEDPFAENWGLSQFWYSDETAEKVACECCRVAQDGAVACVACPSIFRKLRQKHPTQRAHLFEYDTRFQVLGDFSFYDYNHPLGVDESLQGTFKVVVIDPPYLSSECLEKTVQTMKILGETAEKPVFLALTGASMHVVLHQLLDLRPVKWRPQHKNKLGNEFCMFARDECIAAAFGGWDSRED